jgi:hypothetical protein
MRVSHLDALPQITTCRGTQSYFLAGLASLLNLLWACTTCEDPDPDSGTTSIRICPVMNSQMAGTAGKALLFMHRCRQSSRLQIPVYPVRYASQANPIASNASASPARVSRLTPANRPDNQGTFSQGRSPTEVRVDNRGPSIWTAIKTILGVKPKIASDFVPAPFNVVSNPYRARKKWPPNFKNLHPKHQFRYEKTYRRRMKLKYARPTWTKATKIVQWTLIYGVLFYWIFLLDMGDDGTPFDNVSRMRAKKTSLRWLRVITDWWDRSEHGHSRRTRTLASCQIERKMGRAILRLPEQANRLGGESCPSIPTRV